MRNSWRRAWRRRKSWLESTRRSAWRSGRSLWMRSRSVLRPSWSRRDGKEREMAPGGVTAIVLAAGESRRMGTPKPRLPYGSGSVIQAVVRSLKASPVDPVLVVLGHRHEEIAAHLEGSGVEIVLNPRYLEGMLTSVQAGIAAAPP